MDLPWKAGQFLTQILRLVLCYLWAWFLYFKSIWRGQERGSSGEELEGTEWSRLTQAMQRWFGFLFACLFYCFPSLPRTGKLGPHWSQPSTSPPSSLPSPLTAICLRWNRILLVVLADWPWSCSVPASRIAGITDLGQQVCLGPCSLQ